MIYERLHMTYNACISINASLHMPNSSHCTNPNFSSKGTITEKDGPAIPLGIKKNSTSSYIRILMEKNSTSLYAYQPLKIHMYVHHILFTHLHQSSEILYIPSSLLNTLSCIFQSFVFYIFQTILLL